MDEKLLDIVCCPLSHEPLRKMDSGQLASLNQAIADGTLTQVDGTKLSGQLRAALVTHDGRRAYSIDDGLVNLLPGAALELGDLQGADSR
ncbi:MAG: Trm112 family protein [Pseudomonadota bacterium]